MLVSDIVDVFETIVGGEECLDWKKRYKVALGIADGLSYLHNDCPRRIIHRDIKASNILLSQDYEAQVLIVWIQQKNKSNQLFCVLRPDMYPFRRFQILDLLSGSQRIGLITLFSLSKAHSGQTQKNPQLQSLSVNLMFNTKNLVGSLFVLTDI